MFVVALLAAELLLPAKVGLFADAMRPAGIRYLQAAVLDFANDADDLLRAVSLLHVSFAGYPAQLSSKSVRFSGAGSESPPSC
jgi:hypothetical protein